MASSGLTNEEKQTRSRRQRALIGLCTISWLIFDSIYISYFGHVLQFQAAMRAYFFCLFISIDYQYVAARFRVLKTRISTNFLRKIEYVEYVLNEDGNSYENQIFTPKEIKTKIHAEQILEYIHE